MPAAINLNGVPAGYVVPGVLVELDFAVGQSGGSGAARAVLLMGNKTSAGSATADTVIYGPNTAIPCQTEADVIALFGPGSQLHRMFIRFVKAAGVNNTTPLFFIAVTASGGTAASTTMTIATTAAATGNHRFWCLDQFVDTPITTGQTVTQIATAIVASINAQTSWPITAANTAGVITITWKHAGPEGNWGRVQALLTGTGVATTTTLTSNTFLTSGATADSYTSALSTIASQRFYYIVCGDSDATNVGALVTQVNSLALPTNGNRQRVVFGSMDTLANTITLATGVNAARAECVWGNATDMTPAELAATATAIYATLEQGSQYGVNRKNFSLFPAQANDASYWPVIAGRNGAGGAPTQAQIYSALQNGITPITVLQTGAAQMVKRITTRSLNGSTADYRIRDAHKVTVCDYFCDDVAAITTTQCGGKDLLPDPIPGQPVPPTAVTPRVWKGLLQGQVSNYGDLGQWSYIPGNVPQQGQTPADMINANFQGPQIETANPNRMSVSIPLSPCAIFDVAAILAMQVG